MKKLIILTVTAALLLGVWGPVAAQTVTLRFSAWGNPE